MAVRQGALRLRDLHEDTTGPGQVGEEGMLTQLVSSTCHTNHNSPAGDVTSLCHQVTATMTRCSRFINFTTATPLDCCDVSSKFRDRVVSRSGEEDGVIKGSVQKGGVIKGSVQGGGVIKESSQGGGVIKGNGQGGGSSRGVVIESA